MKKLTPVIWLALAVFLAIGSFQLWADEKVLVAGEPPITAFAVDCHIRLLEFAVMTRLTVAQKDAFMAAVVDECREMSKEEREDFIEAIDLADSLGELDEEQLDELQAELADDFAHTAAELPDDAASQLFSSLQAKSTQKMLQEGEILITEQAIDAFIEYLAFLAQPDQPVWYDQAANQTIKDILTSNFVSNLTHAEKDALEDFQSGWYMIRGVWQNTENPRKKEIWRRNFAACQLKPGMVPEINMIKAALAEKVFAELIEEASQYGIEPYEWAAELGVRVW